MKSRWVGLKHSCSILVLYCVIFSQSKRFVSLCSASPLCRSLKDGDSNSLTTDNLERHGQLSHHPALPDGGALLSEAKLQSIMSFLDEMEKSEQERPRSVTSGSHREVRTSLGSHSNNQLSLYLTQMALMYI